MTLSLARRNKKKDHDDDYDHSKFHKLKRQLFPWSASAHDKGRRSSIGAFFQSICRHEQPLFDARRRRSTSSFANDALFEKYRYKKQSTIDLGNKSQSAPPSSLPSSHDNDDEEAMTPRVICWQDDKLPQGILVKHRHTASLQYSSPHTPLHRRSRSTATHIRHYSHVSYISSSNITAHSEDLTAKEFADIAGIKILPEDDDQSQHNELTVEETNNDQVSLDEECLSVKSSGMSALKPTIMDDAFWRNESTSTKSSDEEDIPPLPRLLPPLPPQRKVIKKGRFEIHVESAA